tara:strand:- start:242 stop:523 length:282 start_codon:yes stop_codon:yes gene_type:complete
MKILVTGVLDFIGSHIVQLAQDLNHEFTVQDDFLIGNKWAIQGCEIFELDLLNRDNLFKKLSKKVLGRNLNYSSIHKITHTSSDLHKNLFPFI